MRRCGHGSSLCHFGGHVLVGIQQGAFWDGPVPCLYGATWGCTRVPTFPPLYALFTDPILQDMQSLSHPDMPWVGPAAPQRKLVGQANADDLAGLAATQKGLQWVVQAAHTHRLRWAWLLNVPKSVFMVFGKQSVRARLDAPELWWGACRLPTVDTVK